MGVTPDQKTMIAFPMDTGPTALFYREDLFQKAGLPTDPQQVANTIKTWKDYFDAAQKLKNIGVYAFDNIGDNVFINATQQKTTLFLDTNNNFVGDRQEIKDIFDMAVQARKLGYSANVARYTTDWNAAMNTGKVASFVGAVWMKQILEDAAPDTSGKWRIAPAPGGPGNSGGSFIAISASSKHPQEAWQAIKWMMSAENQKRQLKTMNLFPSAKAVFDDESVFVKEPFFGGQETNRVFADAAKNIPVFYYGPNTEGIRGLYTEQLKLVESQNKAADKAWQDALKNIKKQYFSGR